MRKNYVLCGTQWPMCAACKATWPTQLIGKQMLRLRCVLVHKLLGMWHKRMLLHYVGHGALAQISNSLGCSLDEVVKEAKGVNFAIKRKDAISGFNHIAGTPSICGSGFVT